MRRWRMRIQRDAFERMDQHHNSQLPFPISPLDPMQLVSHPSSYNQQLAHSTLHPIIRRNRVMLRFLPSNLLPLSSTPFSPHQPITTQSTCWQGEKIIQPEQPIRPRWRHSTLRKHFPTRANHRWRHFHLRHFPIWLECYL